MVSKKLPSWSQTRYGVEYTIGAPTRAISPPSAALTSTARAEESDPGPRSGGRGPAGLLDRPSCTGRRAGASPSSVGCSIIPLSGASPVVAAKLSDTCRGPLGDQVQ